MNKVTTINLDGRAYQLEEPGYDKLRAYLNEASATLGNDPDAQEIVLDLERAIAEKCDTYLTRGKTVVATAEVEQIIKDMGPVHAADAGQEKAAGSSGAADPNKRLYRVREGAWILGVCSGLAAFLDVNVTAIRIIAVILALATHGGFIFAYLVAAIFIHPANTPEKRAAAHGMPFSTQELIARAYSLRDEFKENSKEWKRYRRAMKRDYRAQQDHSGWAFMGPFFGAISLLWVFALLSVITTHALFGFALPATMPLWLAIVLLVFIYSAIISPLRYMAFAHKMPGKDLHHYYPPGPIGFLFQVLSIWFVGWLLYTYVPTAHDFMVTVWNQIQQIPGLH